MPLTRVRQRATVTAPRLSVAGLSDPATVTSIEGLSSRLAELNDLFNRTNDRRGVFTAIYAPCVRRLVKEIRAGNVKDPATAERVVLALGKGYLEGLHRNGQGAPGGTGSTWDSFSGLVKKPSVSDARLLASSINAHWSADLPRALATARAPANFGGDLQKIGGFLVDEVEHGLATPSGPNGRSVAKIFESQPALAGLRRVFGLDTTIRAGMATLMTEAMVSGRGLPALGGANQLKWSVREGLIGLL